MRIPLISICVSAPLLLGACQLDSPSAPQDGAKDGVPNLATTTCPANQLQHLVGTTYTDGVVTHGGRVRVITPRSAVTMDHIPSRLNVHVDDNGVIQVLSCG